MILVTVGTQLPFDRLLQAVDEAALTLPVRIFAQAGRGAYRPINIDWRSDVPAGEFDAMATDATLIVSHAGIGTVLLAQRKNKPIVIFPRRVEYGEHRNDHQLATANALRGRTGIFVADDVATLQEYLTTLPGSGARLTHDSSLPRDALRSGLSQYLKQVSEWKTFHRT